ncbi:nucleoside deaminase [Rhodococcus sp. D2-41]|uniref:Nucleoside deaminase n=1 Tax=Speluncibacter jeojiensis TaxID=2710754 RepID=A0A9X4LWS2_9ACTN|nr:nucleoside deaminase [Rhodococcus sp. D2-41]MDG3012089.1 nucleoside deaminase [Rhodococcus sp. D2-41]MDG3013614.1 nucleoside deaminase [Corynebacteriales bacterium D3-21]
MVDASEMAYLRRCIELARESLETGDQPFGSVLVSADGAVLAEDRNRVGGGDHTRHPEFTLARWAAANVEPDLRAGCTVYTSGEHCPMCSAAHAWVGLGRIVYVASAEQHAQWLRDWGVPPAPVAVLPIEQVAPGITVDGPVPELVDEIRELHRRLHSGN